MLPIEPWLFAPSLLIVPVVIAGAIYVKKSKRLYVPAWIIVFAVCCTICLLFTAYTINFPLHSNQSKSPANPGGFSASAGSLLESLVMLSCFVAPSFPLAIALAYLSPREWKKRTRVIIAIATTVAIAIAVLRIGLKDAAYSKDFKNEKQKILNQVDQFEHVRRT